MSSFDTTVGDKDRLSVSPNVSLVRDNGLVLYQAAKHALSEAARIDEVKDIRDKAKAMQVYAQQAKDRELLEHATEIRMRAEIKAGEMLRGLEKNQGAIPGRTGKKARPVLDNRPKLSDLGVSKWQSSLWQKLAALSKREQEEKIERAKHKAEAAVTKPVVQMDNRIKTKPTKEKHKKALHDWITDIISLVSQAIGSLERDDRIHLLDRLEDLTRAYKREQSGAQ